jgi:hypothetical protein
MAVLTTAEKDALFLKLMSDYSRVCEALPNMVKQDIKDGITDIDQWVEDNKISYNNALPIKLKNNMTDRQKAIFLAEVVQKKGEVA